MSIILSQPLMWSYDRMCVHSIVRFVFGLLFLLQIVSSALSNQVGYSCASPIVRLQYRISEVYVPRIHS